MQLFLQFGYGMMGHSRDLIERWNGGTVILSPRDLSPEQMTRLGGQVRSLPNARVLIDPQLYMPHSDHARLRSHSYWPQEYDTATFWSGPPLQAMLAALFDANDQVGTERVILPSVFAARIDDDWFAVQEAIIEESQATHADRPRMITLALSGGALADAAQIGNLIERAEQWPIRSFYVVCEHPNGDYLVQDPNWLANVLDLIAGLKLQRSFVLLGYCTHQQLAAAAAGVDAIASGTWMNVRSFPPEKFNTAYEDEIRQRATWFYSPAALCEFKLPFLDIAQRLGVLPLLHAPADLDWEFGDPIFSGAQPSVVGFTEQAAFRHYLCCLHGQCAAADQSAFDAAADSHDQVLNAAENLLGRLAGAGVRGQQRDFGSIVDVNRAALSVLRATRGPMLRRHWNDIVGL